MLDPTQAIAALPEEDLLTDEVAPTQSDLSLDQTVLETLSEDLAQLETSRPERLVPEATTDASTGFDEANEGQDLFGEARWQPAGMEPAAVADDVVGGEDSLGVSDLFSDAFAAFPSELDSPLEPPAADREDLFGDVLGDSLGDWPDASPPSSAPDADLFGETFPATPSPEIEEAISLKTISLVSRFPLSRLACLAPMCPLDGLVWRDLGRGRERS